MSLPKPRYIFTIPSIQDDTVLDCRLYHPLSKHRKTSTNTAWSAAIVAHPYGPLGGSQDDPVVSVISSVLLKHGFIVGTFNFRGVGGSTGRTSWSAKLELADYVSFYGCMLAYLNGINVEMPSSEGHMSLPSDGAILILGGYSYGSLIAKNLPSLQVVMEIFASPSDGSAQAEIILRARDLSKQYLEKQEQRDQSNRGRESLRISSGMLVGGFESEDTSRRISRGSSRRSLDLEGVRRSIDRIRKRPSRSGSARHDLSYSGTPDTADAFSVLPRVCYLLISPLLPPITALLSLSTKIRLPASLLKGKKYNWEDQLQLHPSCCVFGHHDMFTSHKRLQKWSKKLQEESEGRFSSYEVEPAGHFWHEEGAESGLKNAIQMWLGGF